MTLIFTVSQATAAISAGANYLFPFIGRSDEYGLDDLKLIQNIQTMVNRYRYPVLVVATSVKNLRQLEETAVIGVPYAAIPYALYLKALDHPLTDRESQDFERDWRASGQVWQKNCMS